MNNRDPENGVRKITLLLASTFAVMVTAAMAPALPAIQAHFAEQTNATFLVRLVLTLPSLLIAAASPVAGYIVDRIGRKTVLAVSSLAFGIAGVAGYFAPTLTSLLISRAVLGIAVGASMTTVTTLIADYYVGPARGRFMGLQAAFMGFGGTVFFALSGVLADVGWRAPFLTHAIAFAVLPLILVALYEPSVGDRCEEKPHPVVGPGECVAESVRASRGVRHVNRAAASPPIGFFLFVYLVMMGSQIVFFLIPVQLPFYLLNLTGASASQSGLAISMMTVFYALTSLQYGRVASRFDHFQVFTAAFSLIGVGYLLIWLAGGWALLLLGLVLAGTGLGLLMPNLSVWLADETPAALRGRVMGALTTALFLGRFLSPIASQPLVVWVGLGRLFAGAGVAMLVMAPFFWVARDRLRSLTRLWSGGEIPEAVTVSVDPTGQDHGLEFVATTGAEPGSSPCVGFTPGPGGEESVCAL
ncbi:MAG: MFS transporter [Anaerolineae bacterium]|jgi:MFS family permease